MTRGTWTDRLLWCGAAVAAAVAAGCVGAIDGDDPLVGGGMAAPAPGQPGARQPGGPRTNPSATTAPQPAPAPPPVATPAAGPAPLRRLTRREYDNTIRDLLGIETRVAEQFPSDSHKGWLFPRAVQVASLDAIALQAAAESLAAEAVTKHLAALLPCDPAKAGEASCARQFVETFGARAFRRPLHPDELDRYLTAGYQAARDTLKLGFGDAIGFVIEAMLQAPGFLYHGQAGPGPVAREGQTIRLGPYELASRLSYFAWGTMPDRELFAAAAAGRLGTEAEVQEHARRLLRDPRARETVAAFVDGWLGLEGLASVSKSTSAYKDWGEPLRAAMTEEARAFARATLFDGDAKWETLLTASFSFVNRPLAAIYGLPDVTSTAMQKTALDPTQRQGLFTQGAWLTLTGAHDGSYPTRRGQAIWVGALCHEIPPPPPDIPAIKAPSTGVTTRQRFEEHEKNGPSCTACHRVLDPIGYAFEHYDGVGRYRATEAGKPVDATGSVHLDGETRAFANAPELARLLAASADARRCFATQWTRYALGRLEVEADAASIDAAVAKLVATGDVRELLATLASSRMFRYRAINPGEVLP